jgi:predicted TPR repeat methyltransferase
MRRGSVLTRSDPAALLRELDAAKAEHQKGSYAEARKRYQSILERQPELTPALHFLGVLEHMDGNSKAGLELVQRAYRQSPDDYDIRKNLGNLLNDLNRSEEAEPLYRGLVSDQPTDPTNHSNHSVALRKLGRHDEAVAAARQAIALAAENPVAWLALANALAARGENEPAVRAYEHVIALKPAFSPVHNSVCQLLLQIEKSGIVSRFHLRRTRQSYRRWLEAVPGHPTATFMLDALEKGRVPARMPDAAVKASFDSYAETFDKHIRMLDYCAPERVGEMLDRRLPGACADLDVLDGGCGTGLAAPLLRPRARHLTGVDLSSAMLERAREAGNYDVLVEAELGSFLEAHTDSFDVCAFVDVLTYFGDLHAIVMSAARALRPGGCLAFSVEKANRRGSHLHSTGRYSHHRSHVEAAIAAAGLMALEVVEAKIRSENDAPVIGLIVSAQRPA